MNNATKGIAAGLASGVIGLGLILPAMAQDATTTDEAAEATTEDAPAASDGLSDRGADFAAALADELGLDEQTVADAVEAVRDELRDEHAAARAAAVEERLAAAVADGDLTQEQADAITAAIESGALPFGGMRGGPGIGGRGFGGPGFHGHGLRGDLPPGDDGTADVEPSADAA